MPSLRLIVGFCRRLPACICVVLGVAALMALASSESRASPSSTTGSPKTARPPAIQAASAILVDAESGQVLFEKQADDRRPPASTTKILTAVLLLEHVQPDTLIMADKTVAETDGSSLYMLPGEKIAARELLYALMLRSANDACVAIAKHIAGSEADFAEMMNRKAEEIGATNSHFANPNGLPMKEHYTTARDLARIACYAMRIPEFRDAVRTRYHTIVRDPRNKDTFLKNRDKFLWHYPGADGIKTGYTVPAGRCFVGSASRNGWRLISVVLHSPDIFGETRQLMDYGFGTFEPRVIVPTGGYGADVPVRGGSLPSVRAVLSEPIRIVSVRGSTEVPELRPRFREVAAPVNKGAQVGEVVASMHDGTTVTAPLVASVGVPLPPPPPPPGPVWPRLLATAFSLAVFWYGSANTKATGLVGRGIATGVRSAHRFGARHRQR
jgi:D-alanyl-D-alanine carboxypeptidase (penicillin-binding protein 5/6)